MLYTVGEMAKRIGVAPSALRYYDKEGLFPFVERSSSGMRMFKDADYEIGFNLIVGQKLAITILSEIRESYPVQVTAVRIELLEDAPDPTPEYRRTTPENAKEMIDGGDVFIHDVRTDCEFAEAHIEGAILLPRYDIEARASEILTDMGERFLYIAGAA